ncbi:MAG TPA: hypothetical protein VKB05_17905 [Pyrinomonadaceae bacterium]|nr:hypothetical protein [Pyrinomonadaceae bacterium]
MPPILAAFFAFTGPAFWMSTAALVLLVIGVLAARNDSLGLAAWTGS